VNRRTRQGQRRIAGEHHALVDIEGYRAHRKANRPFRSAFRGIVHGELGRKILLAVGVSNAKRKDATNG
jgi:hypothetical protein